MYENTFFLPRPLVPAAQPLSAGSDPVKLSTTRAAPTKCMAFAFLHEKKFILKWTKNGIGLQPGLVVVLLQVQTP
jgi:hypothetical protein